MFGKKVKREYFVCWHCGHLVAIEHMHYTWIMSIDSPLRIRQVEVCDCKPRFDIILRGKESRYFRVTLVEHKDSNGQFYAYPEEARFVEHYSDGTVKDADG